MTRAASAVRVLLVGLVGLVGLSAVDARAQDPAAADPAAADPAATDPAAEAPPPEPPPPTVPEALTFINEVLAANPSPWRPCRSATSVDLSEDGYLSVVVERSSYCEHSRVRAHVSDLDPAALEVGIEDRGEVRVACRGGESCARYGQKRKVRVDEAWTLRDDEWIPRPLPGGSYQLDAVEVLLASDAKAAAQVSSALAYVVRSAQRQPAYQPPADPFAGRVAAAPVASE